MDRTQQDKDEIFLLGLMGVNTSDVIEAQEKRGQEMLVRSTVLPQRCLYCERADLEAMGIQFHEVVDNLFVKVTLPEGWKLEPANHSMWSDMVDHNGRKRAAIFYKAAFYDRRAHISINHRFQCRWEPICGYGGDYYPDCKTWVYRAVDQDKAVIWQSEPYEFPSEKVRMGYNEQDPHLAAQWLDDNYPDWRNVNAYWDLPDLEDIGAPRKG